MPAAPSYCYLMTVNTWSHPTRCRRTGGYQLIMLLLVMPTAAWAQEGSRNLEVVSQAPVEGGTGAMALEQDRPLVWLARQGGGLLGLDISDLTEPVTAYSMVGSLVHDLAVFQVEGTHYLALASDAPALMILDVSSLAAVQPVATLKRSDGYHALFAYKHSSGRALLFATSGGPVEAFDIEDLLSGQSAPLIAIDTPADVPAATKGFDQAFAGFEPVTATDRLYLAGAGGYYVYDVTDLDSTDALPLLTHISSAAVQRGRAIVPLPDASQALTLAAYRTAPVRIFALNNARVRTATEAWMADWQHEYVALQVRWPFAFVAALEGGLFVVNIFDPESPYTDAWYRTLPLADDAPLERNQRGIVAVDVRNEDGLIVASDLESGFWAFRLEAFSGWSGPQWGLPDMSNAQDWDQGPDRQQ